MKITHLCLACFFPDGYSYQENLLPKYHKRLGYEVEVIASLLTFGAHGEQAYMDHPDTYINENGIKVVRLDYRSDSRLSKKLQLFKGLYGALEDSSPDILFIHGCQFVDIKQVVKYLKQHPGIEVYVDNHADYSNSATNVISKYILHRLLWKHCAQLIAPYAKMFWGVLPARVDFLIENYGLPKSKCSLLLMGADDDEVERATALAVRNQIRSELGIKNDDYLIVTGGKIDSSKAQTLLLMDAIKQSRDSACLLIFGPVSPDMEGAFRARLQSCKRIIWKQWANASESYDYFSAADLVCFPGRHSVYWEQAAGMAKPLLVRDWPGTHHVDICGNAVFLKRDEVQAIMEGITLIKSDSSGSVKQAADKAAGYFRYSAIAKKSIGGSHD